MANACAAQGYRQCKTLLKEMSQFAELNKRAETLRARDLKRLIALDRKISDGKGSTLAKNAAIRAGNMLYQCATSAKATGNWGRAAECANQALAMDPRNAGAQAIAAEAQSHAKEEYMLGYAAKDNNPDAAIAKFREVMSMTPPSNEYHQKAQNWLEKLQRQ
jgi:tetratricopeptide (TPR) repeat protein